MISTIVQRHLKKWLSICKNIANLIRDSWSDSSSRLNFSKSSLSFLSRSRSSLSFSKFILSIRAASLSWKLCSCFLVKLLIQLSRSPSYTSFKLRSSLSWRRSKAASFSSLSWCTFSTYKYRIQVKTCLLRKTPVVICDALQGAD